MTAGRTAFLRAKAMFAAISAIVSQFQADMVGQRAALAALPEYRSGGKGGKRAHRPTGIAAAKRAALKCRNQKRHRAACRRAH